MSARESPLHALESFLPAGTYPAVAEFLHRYKVQLTITRARRTVLGDYRHATRNTDHRITVNGNLNSYAFLITLLHELAHLLTFDTYGNRVAAHGKEWKSRFSELLTDFLKQQIFPPDISQAIRASLHNPAASSCADDQLTRVLRNYDQPRAGLLLVEELAPGTVFAVRGGRIFRRGQQLRKRIRCTELATGREYLFSPVFEVSIVPTQ